MATDRIQVYDVRRKQWTESNDTLPRPTSGICAAMHKDEYIVVIGSEVSGAMDTNTGNWIDFEEFPSEPNLMPVPKVRIIEMRRKFSLPPLYLSHFKATRWKI